MQLDFTHGDKTVPVPYGGAFGGFIKLYEVPATYSDDCYYAAVWQQGELEAVPACEIGIETLLAYVAIDLDGAGLKARTIYLAKEVAYAES